MRKWLWSALAAATVMAVPLTANAAEKINSVSISFHAEDSGDEEPYVEADTRGNHYSAGSVSLASEYYSGDESESKKYEGDNKTYVVELSADDGYYFNITKSDKVKLNGEGAEFVRASRRDNGSTLIITAKLNNIESYLGTVDAASWRNDGYGIWEAANGTKYYKLRLTDQKNKTRLAQTGGLQYDFRPFLTKAGTYTYKVRPVAEDGRLGEWTDGGSFQVSEDQAAANKEKFKVLTETTYMGGEKSPSSQQVTYLNVGWQQAEDGRYFYRNEDGSYLQQDWKQEGDAWYFFDKDGYMVTNNLAAWGGKDYYFQADGKMQTGGKTPDGRSIGTDGAVEGVSKTADNSELADSATGPGAKR